MGRSKEAQIGSFSNIATPHSCLLPSAFFSLPEELFPRMSVKINSEVLQVQEDGELTRPEQEEGAILPSPPPPPPPPPAAPAPPPSPPDSTINEAEDGSASPITPTGVTTPESVDGTPPLYPTRLEEGGSAKEATQEVSGNGLTTTGTKSVGGSSRKSWGVISLTGSPGGRLAAKQ